MNWLNKLERKFGRYAVPNLIVYLIGAYSVGFVLNMVAPNILGFLNFQPYYILHGQIWRLITWILMPTDSNIIFLLIMMMFYYLLNGDQGQQAREYLENRRMSKETQIHFGLGYASKYSNDLYLYLKKKGYQDQILKETGLLTYDEKRGAHDKFWNRVMFPIMDVNNRVIGFGGRVMGDGTPKYLNSPETMLFDKSRNLYGLNLLTERHGKAGQRV